MSGKKTIVCEECAGSGNIEDDECPFCLGDGSVEVDEDETWEASENPAEDTEDEYDDLVKEIKEDDDEI